MPQAGLFEPPELRHPSGGKGRGWSAVDGERGDHAQPFVVARGVFGLVRRRRFPTAPGRGHQAQPHLFGRRGFAFHLPIFPRSAVASLRRRDSGREAKLGEKG